ncbi:MAG: glycosyltransferase family 2 protein [Culturomica sp.]|jgi:glycosyltransferase involved in cell wall biosynthesis|nr:glycosyltransferase family 2 protein [Culturomica sp.]
MDLSVIVPLYNEEESITELTKWIADVMKKNNFSYEIIMVDDGSKDNSWNVIQKLADDNNNIHGIKLKRNYGKSAALHCGFQSAEGDVVITMDADLQDSPDEIPELYRMIKDEHYDLVSGWKQKRYDPISKTMPTKLFNAAARVASGIKLHDFNCGLKAYRKNVIKDIEVYGEMHRYIPVLAKQAGYTTIGEKVVIHRARKFGVSKFGINRFINGFLDLLSISFISRFSKKPMHFFGSLGTLLFLISLMAIVGIGVTKYFYLKSGHPAPLITSTPYFYIALTGMILGTQLFLAGFLAELISRSASNRNDYVIDKKI